MSSSNRPGRGRAGGGRGRGRGRGRSGGGDNNPVSRTSSSVSATATSPPTPAAAAASSSSSTNNNHGGWGSPSRFGHFAKYTKPKIGPAFQCAVPEFVPKDGGGSTAPGSEAGDESAGGNVSVSSASATSSQHGHGTRSSTGRGGRGRGRGRGRGGRGGRGRGRGGGRGSGPSGTISTTTSCEGMAKAEQSIASGETSAVDIANAAAEHLQDNYGSRSIPRGGLCVHKPTWHRFTKDDTTDGSATAAGGLLPLSTESSGVAGASTLQTMPVQQQPQAAVDKHEEFLTFTRNVFLQTPRPQSETSIDKLWDSGTVKKFTATATPAAPAEKSSGRGRGRKRKAAAAGEDGESIVGNKPNPPIKSEEPDNQASSMNVSTNDQSETKMAQQGQEASEVYPLCGLEDDEYALSYLQANYHGDSQTAKLSILVNSDKGYGKLLCGHTFVCSLLDHPSHIMC